MSFGLISVWFFSWSMQNDKISRRVRHPPRLWALKYIFFQIRKTMRKIKPLRSVFNLLKIYRNESLLKVRKKSVERRQIFNLKIASLFMNSMMTKNTYFVPDRYFHAYFDWKAFIPGWKAFFIHYSFRPLPLVNESQAKNFIFKRFWKSLKNYKGLRK